MTDVRQAQPPRDPTLQHPRCVFQILKRHFARYTPEFVSQVCGCTPEELVQVAELLCANSGRERTSAIVYALGWTQHTTGVQMIRTAGILQLLLGNMGRPGGGIMAMRGHSTIQGSTDLATLYDVLPGYLPQPCRRQAARNARLLRRARGPAHRLLGPTSASSSSACSRPGTATPPRRRTTSASRGCRGWTPTTRSWPTSTAWRRARSRATSCSARTPAAAGPTPACTGPACASSTGWWSLDWFEIESAVFWKSDPNGPPPAEIKTEVFFFPAAAAPEKEGSLTNTQRLIQWHDKAIDPLGDSRSDAWFLYNLGKRLKALYAGSTDPRDQPLLHLTWDYDFDERPRLPDGTLSRIEGEPDLEKVLQEINGYEADREDGTCDTGRARHVC